MAKLSGALSHSVSHPVSWAFLQVAEVQDNSLVLAQA